MKKNTLWSRKEEKELMAKARSNVKNKIKEVNNYITENNIGIFKMGEFRYNSERLTTEEKLLVYYNILATREENYWKDTINFSWTEQKEQLDFLCNTSERRDLFITQFLGNGISIMSDIIEYRKYQKEIEGRAKDITYEDLDACINYDDLIRSDWYKLNHLIQELYLKPCHVVNMELIYDALMQGYSMKDIWTWYEIEPNHMFKFRQFNMKYSKEKVSKYLEAKAGIPA